MNDNKTLKQLAKDLRRKDAGYQIVAGILFSIGGILLYRAGAHKMLAIMSDELAERKVES